MTAAHRQRIDGPAAWTRAELAGKDDVFTLDLAPAQRGELDAAMAAARARGLTRDEIGPADFPLPGLAAGLAELAHEIAEGHGLALVRGLPVADHGQAEIEILYWGLCSHLGTAVSQSVMGDRLGHVIDVTAHDPHARAYRDRRRLHFHTDLSDVAALLCLRTGRAGGLNQFVSALAVHNAILDSRPELLEPLYRGFHWHRLGEEGAGEAPITPWRVPVYSCRDGRVSVRYSRTYVREALHALGEPSKLEAEALACFDKVCLRPELVLEFGLEPGEAVFMNNFTVMHGRSAFEDHADPERRRHLLRLWLAVPDGRPVVPDMRIFDAVRPGGIPRREAGRTPSFPRQAPVEEARRRWRRPS